MSLQETKRSAEKKRWTLSLDGWAVLLALLAAFLVRAGALKHVPW